MVAIRFVNGFEKVEVNLKKCKVRENLLTLQMENI